MENSFLDILHFFFYHYQSKPSLDTNYKAK